MTSVAYQGMPASESANAPDVMTLAKIRETKFKVFAGECQAEQTAAIEYIERMAQEGAYHIEHWDILDVFKNGQSDTKKIITDKRSINKRLYEYSKLAKEGVPFEIKPYEAQLKEFAENEMQVFRKRIIENAEAQAKANFDNATAHLQEANRRMAAGAAERLKAHAAAGKASLDIFGQTKDILSAGFWKFLDFNQATGDLNFTNIKPVILGLVNKQAGQDFKVYMGYYKAQLNVRNLNSRVLPLKENLYVGQTPGTRVDQMVGRSHWHPYLSRHGEICFGNAADIAYRHLERCEFREYMALLSQLLSNYSRDTSPYVSLESFHAASLAQARSLSGSTTNSTGSTSGVAGATTSESGNGDVPLVSRPICGNCNRVSADDAQDDEADCECTTCDTCAETYDPENGEECSCEYCGICDERYFSEPDCNCCHDCESTQSNCECCGDCGNTAEDCTRCRECDRHGGHNEGCPEAPATQEGVSDESSH